MSFQRLLLMALAEQKGSLCENGPLEGSSEHRELSAVLFQTTDDGPYYALSSGTRFAMVQEKPY
jgi:hypothetical protein